MTTVQAAPQSSTQQSLKTIKNGNELFIMKSGQIIKNFDRPQNSPLKHPKKDNPTQESPQKQEKEVVFGPWVTNYSKNLAPGDFC